MTPYAYNKTRGEHCPYCLDDGIVTLQGSITKHGYTYSRGSAPCKWCEVGSAAFTAAQTKRLDPASSFTLLDIEIPEPYVPATKAEARAAIAAIQAMWSKPRPVTIDKTETSGDVKRRIQQAQEALTPEPEPFAPPSDDIPF